MPLAPSKTRRAAGPWVVIEVPMNDPDPLYPTRRRFFSTETDSSAEHIERAHRFTDYKEARYKANRIMHTSRNTWAEAIHFSMAWALVYAGGAQWKPRIKSEGAHVEVKRKPK